MTTIAQLGTAVVTVGVDTHLDVHVAVALDQLGRRLGDIEIAATADGYEELVAWAESFGEPEAFGVEGTGCYGAGLARMLRAQGYLVVEVIRPNRRTRRHKGKSDLIDAEAAARAVMSGEATGAPKSGDDLAEVIRVLRVDRQTAINSMRALLVTAPEDLRTQLRALDKDRLIAAAARLRPGEARTVTNSIKTSLRGLARRCQHLDGEIAQHDAELEALVRVAAPELVELFGFGTDTAGQLIVTAGDNPERLRSDAGFSMLCGASPKPAGSGKTSGHHRLDRGGDRQANAALYRVALVRMRWHQPTRYYVARRPQEGKTRREIIRCLKRYTAPEAYAALISSPALNAVTTAA